MQFHFVFNTMQWHLFRFFSPPYCIFFLMGYILLKRTHLGSLSYISLVLKNFYDSLFPSKQLWLAFSHRFVFSSGSDASFFRLLSCAFFPSVCGLVAHARSRANTLISQASSQSPSACSHFSGQKLPKGKGERMTWSFT